LLSSLLDGIKVEKHSNHQDAYLGENYGYIFLELLGLGYSLNNDEHVTR
jgi:hypothetical protein